VIAGIDGEVHDLGLTAREHGDGRKPSFQGCRQHGLTITCYRRRRVVDLSRNKQSHHDDDTEIW
jgi:hypothetical protein